MNVMDSSGWLAYFADSPNAEHFAPAIEATAELIAPVITLYEVYKRVLAQREESEALRAVAQMRQGQVVDVDTSLALEAARLSHTLQLPMADSLILATARRFDATLWTQDADFEAIEGVRYIPYIPKA